MSDKITRLPASVPLKKHSTNYNSLREAVLDIFSQMPDYAVEMGTFNRSNHCFYWGYRLWSTYGRIFVTAYDTTINVWDLVDGVWTEYVLQMTPSTNQ